MERKVSEWRKAPSPMMGQGSEDAQEARVGGTKTSWREVGVGGGDRDRKRHNLEEIEREDLNFKIENLELRSVSKDG